MSELINSWLTGSSPYLVLLIPTFAFLECCIGIGVFISGIFLLTTATVMYANNLAGIGPIVALAFLGALAGDHLGYLIGRFAGHHIRDWHFIHRFRPRIEKAIAMVEKSAPVTVCVGRLSPPIRSFTPMVAGISGVSQLKFSLCDLLACSLWATGLFLLVTGISSLA